jgi:hypothetical protein
VNIARPVAALAAAGTIALAAPAALAHADTVQPRATGLFQYVGNGETQVLINPPDLECRSIRGDQGSLASNLTDSTVALFAGPGCGGNVTLVSPYRTVADVPGFQSVMSAKKQQQLISAVGGAGWRAKARKCDPGPRSV